VRDPNLAAGTTRTRQRGRRGTKVLTYEVTLTDGVQTAKRLVRQVVTKRPVTRIIDHPAFASMAAEIETRVGFWQATVAAPAARTPIQEVR
jgi:uncharacterized protein YabE (DUF348 family)